MDESNKIELLLEDTKPGRLERIALKLRGGLWSRGSAPDDPEAAILNERLLTYPSNHIYEIRGQSLAPTVQLLKRWKTLSACYPRQIESFLDIGCCKGYFALRVARSANCRTALGIDVVEPFVRVARDVQDYLDIRNARFAVADLDRVAADPAAFGGPFQTVQLVSTYHYLYWGSWLNDQAFLSHAEILSRLATVCDRYLVFANPLDIDEVPRDVRRRAAQSDRARDYNSAAFLTAAAAWFDIFEIGYLDKYRKRPLLLMVKRRRSAGN